MPLEHGDRDFHRHGLSTGSRPAYRGAGGSTCSDSGCLLCSCGTLFLMSGTALMGIGYSAVLGLGIVGTLLALFAVLLISWGYVRSYRHNKKEQEWWGTGRNVQSTITGGHSPSTTNPEGGTGVHDAHFDGVSTGEHSISGLEDRTTGGGSREHGEGGGDQSVSVSWVDYIYKLLLQNKTAHWLICVLFQTNLNAW